MKKYHFVKIAEVRDKQKGTWYFKPESADDIMEHWRKYVSAEMKSGMQEVVANLQRMAEGKLTEHYRSYWGSLVSLKSSIKNEPIWKTASDMENETLRTRLAMMWNGDEIYLPNGLQVFSLVKGFTEVVDEIYTDKLEYPNHKYKIEDVRYIQWNGGIHWYAKVGNMDIVDEQGNQKWNTKDEAVKAVSWYFNNN